MTPMERFIAKTAPAGNDKGCIRWNASTRRAGYGQFFVGRRTRPRMASAHVWIWEQTYGPVPSGYVVMHQCDEPSCVNVEHLTIGTQLDNLADMREKGRQVKGERVGGVRLTAADVANLRKRYCDGESITALADDLGVHRITVHDVIARRTWRHLP